MNIFELLINGRRIGFYKKSSSIKEYLNVVFEINGAIDFINEDFLEIKHNDNIIKINKYKLIN